jgi:hypothetical protein
MNWQQRQRLSQLEARRAQSFFRSPVAAVSPAHADQCPEIWPGRRVPPGSIRYPQLGPASSDAVGGWPFEGEFRGGPKCTREPAPGPAFYLRFTVICEDISGAFRRGFRNLSTGFQHASCLAHRSMASPGSRPGSRLLRKQVLRFPVPGAASAFGAWIELQGRGVSAPRLTLRLAVVRRLFGWLATDQAMPVNPAV